MASRAKPKKKGKDHRAEIVPILGDLLSLPEEERPAQPDFPEVKDPKKRAYAVTFAMTGNHREAAKAAGICESTGLNWRKDTRPKNQAFLQAIEQGGKLACDRIEAEIHRRAIEGVVEPVYQQGRQVGTVRRFSDTLLIFLAKGAMPHKYRDKLEHMGPGGGPIQTLQVGVNLDVLPDKLLAQIETELVKAGEKEEDDES
jgi:hypothetical protein